MGSGMAVSRSSAAPSNTLSHVSKTWTEWDASIKFVKWSDLKTGAKEKNMVGFLRTRQNRKCHRQEAKQSRRLITVTLEKLVNVGETQWNVWSNQIWKRICFCFSRSRQRWWSFCDAGWLWSQGAERIRCNGFKCVDVAENQDMNHFSQELSQTCNSFRP